MSIREEIQQTRPFRSKGQEATVALLRTANALRRRFEAVTKSEDISLQQYNVLRILRGARGPLPTMEIAGRLIEEAPGITRMVNRLESKGFLRREAWAGDRRQVLCQITAAGLRVLDRLEARVDELDDATTGNLSDEQIETLLELLAQIRAGAY